MAERQRSSRSGRDRGLAAGVWPALRRRFARVVILEGRSCVLMADDDGMAYLEQMRGKMAQVRARSWPPAALAEHRSLRSTPAPRSVCLAAMGLVARSLLTSLPSAQMGQAAQVAEMNAGLAQNLQERM